MKFKLILIILLLNFNLLSGTEKIIDPNTIHKKSKMPSMPRTIYCRF